MPSPVFVFGFVLATTYGLGFHVIMGGSARRMVLFVSTSWVGFLLGQYVGGYLKIELFRIGIVHLLPATICSLAMLIFAHLVTLEKESRVTRR